MVKSEAYGSMAIGINWIIVIMTIQLPELTGISERSMISFINYHPNVWLVTIITLPPCRGKTFKCLKKICPGATPQGSVVHLFHHCHLKLAKRSITPGVLTLLMININQRKN